MDAETVALLERLAAQIAAAITRISHGGERPLGLEMLAMSIAPAGDRNDLASQVHEGLADVADAIRTHADAVTELARALGRHS